MKKPRAIQMLFSTAKSFNKGDLFTEGAEKDFEFILQSFSDAQSQIVRDQVAELIEISKELLKEFDDEKVLMCTPIAYMRKFEKLRKNIDQLER